MIYLIESGNFYKIGFTENLKSRMKQYATHNPDCKLIDSFEGYIEDEKQLHELCKEFNHSSEWFNKDNRILEIFQEYKNSDTVVLNKKIKSLEQQVNKLTIKVEMLNNQYKDLSIIVNKTANNESDLIDLCKKIVKWEERTSSRLDILENILSGKYK